MNKQIATNIVFIILAVSIMSAAVYNGSYNRADEIASTACLGCMALDPLVESEFTIEPLGEHPQFVVDALKDSAVFLHYRTDACSACDEMEPTLHEL